MNGPVRAMTWLFSVLAISARLCVDVTTNWHCTWETGPDTGTTRTIEMGDGALIGRAADADLRCDDPDLAARHALLTLGADGGLRAVALTARPMRVDDAFAEGEVLVADGAAIEVGSSTLRCRRSNGLADGPAPAPIDVVGGRVHRPPRALPADAPVVVDSAGPPPTPTPRHGGLLPAVLGLAGSAAIAAVMHQAMFLIFGALGSLVAIAAWAGQRIAAERADRRALRAHEEATRRSAVALDDAFERALDRHLLATPTTATAAQTIERRSTNLWERRSDHPDVWTVSPGRGDWVWQFGDDALAARRAEGAPVPIDLGPGTVLAIRGAPTSTIAVARALALQLAAQCGPADLRIVVVSDDPDAWRWVEHLPHAQLDGRPLVVDADSTGAVLTDLERHPGHVVVITDRCDALTTRTHPLRRALGTAHAPAVIVLLPSDRAVPHVCSAELHIATTTARLVADTTAAFAVPIRPAGVGVRRAVALAERLADLIDPDDTGGGDGLPTMVALTTLLPNAIGEDGAPAAIAAGWLAAGDDPAPRALLGMATDGTIEVDLVRDGPHALIAGTTGSGKSELLRSLIVSLALGSGPQHLTFVLVDYKGGATFDSLADLPHVVGTVTDLDHRLADRALRSLDAELRRRESVLREQGAGDISSLRRARPDVHMPRLVVIVDEFAALAAEQPDFLHALVGIAQRGRSLGLHLILATQRPQGIVSDDIRANTNLRIALRMHDPADALDVVGTVAAAALPRHRPGRAVLRLGPDEHVTFQSASSADDVDELVAACRAAVGELTMDPPDRPWLPPLPDTLRAGDVEAGAVGVIDDPDHQRTVALRWERSSGNLLVAGASGSGTSTALAAAAWAAVSAPRPTHLFVIDARSDATDGPLAALASSPWCAAVTAAADRERVWRVLRAVDDELTRRRSPDAANASAHDVVLVIDGLRSLWQQLDDPSAGDASDVLHRVITTGAAAGVTVAASVEHAGGIPGVVLAAFAHRWVLRLDDPAEASLLGVRPALVPAGRVAGRMVVAATGCEAQLAATISEPIDRAITGGPTRIEPLPARLLATDLEPARRLGRQSLLPIGVAVSDATPAALTIADGEHLSIVGPPRSGRTGALRTITAAWRQATPIGRVLTIDPRQGAAAIAVTLDEIERRASAASPALLTIDDADLVDDVDGRLAALIKRAPLGLTVAIAARADALRQAYGHWTALVRRSRLGVVTIGGGGTLNELDGDLLGASLPHRLPVPQRPGLGWMITGDAPLLVQIAVCGGETGAIATTDADRWERSLALS